MAGHCTHHLIVSGMLESKFVLVGISYHNERSINRNMLTVCGNWFEYDETCSALPAMQCMASAFIFLYGMHAVSTL